MTETEEGIGGSGYTLDDLSAYLDRGRLPAIAAIDTNAECRAVLDSMERVGALSRELLASDVRENPSVDENWLGSLLTSISRELRAGRDIPLSSTDPTTSLSITEGAVRELVRSAGASVDGVLVGSCTLIGTPDGTEPIQVSLTISVVLARPLQELADEVRKRVYSELLKHTELDIEAVNVTIGDVHIMTSEDPR
jgi:hypothetical protein